MAAECRVIEFHSIQNDSQPPSWIFRFANIWSPIRLGRGLICTAMFQISSKSVERLQIIAFNVFQNRGRLPSWIFLQIDFFEQLVSSGGLIGPVSK